MTATNTTGTRLHDTPVSGREPRRAIETTIGTPRGPLHFVAAHLGPLLPRRPAAGRVAGLAEAGNGPTAMAGDFNDWLGSWTDPAARHASDHLPILAEIAVLP